MLLVQSQEQIVQVKKILQEDEARFKHFLGLLEKWIEGHAFIPKNYDKRMLPIFLRDCKYNLDKTKLKLELYFVYKKRYPEAFSFHEFTPAEIMAIKNLYIFEASKLTPDGYRVVLVGFRSRNTAGCDVNVINKLITMSAAYKTCHDVVNGGIIMVYNLRNILPSIVPEIINPSFKRIVEMLQKIYPYRVRAIYLTYLAKLAVPIANMIHMEAGNENMKKNVPMYCLPKEFGGTDGTIDENAAKFVQEIVNANPWFIEQENVQMVGDIPENLYKASGIDENFGTQGSFRKLNID